MADPKQLKFQFVVDEASLQKTRQLIRELTSDLKNLTEAMNKAGTGGGSGGSGGGLSLGQARSPEQARTLTKTTPVARPLVQGLLDQKQIFKEISEGSRGSMKVMSDALSRSISDQKRELAGLKASLDALSMSYTRLGGAASGAVGKKIQNRYLQIQGRVARGEGTLAQLEGMGPSGGELLPDIPWPKQGMVERGRSWLNSGKGEALDIAQRMGWGKLAGFATSGLGVAVGGLALSGYMLNGAYQNWNKSPGIYSSEAANHGNSMQTMVGGVRDLSDLRARQAIQNDSGLREDFNDSTDPGWFRGGVRRISATASAYGKGGVKRAWQEFREGREGTEFQNTSKASARQFLDENKQANAVENDILGETTRNGSSRMSAMRALGLGAGWGTGKKSQNYFNYAENFLNSYGQFDRSMTMGAVQGIAGSGTRGAAYANGSSLTSTVLQAQGAGIQDAASMGGVMSRGGGTGGADFVDRLRLAAGSGVDVSTVGLLGNVVSGQADQMNTARGYQNGGGMLNALSVGTRGDNGGMIARQNIQGMEQTQNLLSGNRDGLQQAINLQLAMKNAPGLGFVGQRQLAQGLKTLDVADIMAGRGQLSGVERSMGITLQMKEAQAKGILNSRLARIIDDPNAAGTGMGKMAAGLKSSGMSIRDYARKAYGKNTQGAINDYAAVLMGMDSSIDESKALGTARMEILGLGSKGPKKGTVPAGDVAGGSSEAKAAEAEAKERKADEAIRNANADKTEDLIASAPDIYKRTIIQAGNLGVSFKQLDAILTSIVKKHGAPGATTKAKPKT